MCCCARACASRLVGEGRGLAAVLLHLLSCYGSVSDAVHDAVKISLTQVQANEIRQQGVVRPSKWASGRWL